MSANQLERRSSPLLGNTTSRGTQDKIHSTEEPIRLDSPSVAEQAVGGGTNSTNGHFASGNASGLIPNTLPSQQTTRPQATRPEIQEGYVATGNVHVIPPAVRNVMAAGWSSHIPLSLLTDAYCRNYSAHESLSATITSVQNGGLRLKVASELPEKGESSITRGEWNQAWPRLLSLIGQHIPGIYGKWHEHYTRIANLEGLDDEWEYCRAYDIKIRKRALREPLDPGLWHPEVMSRCRLEVDTRRRDMTHAEMLASLQSVTQTNSGPYGNGPRTPLRPPRRMFITEPNKFTPSPNKFTPSPKARWFRPREDGESHPATSSSLKCIVCGSNNPAHGTWKYCDASSTIFGKPVFMAEHALEGTTSARFAEVPPITPNRANETELHRIVTPLKADAWERALQETDLNAKFGDIVVGICQGFRLGTSEIPLLHTLIHRNHQSAKANPEAIIKHINKELNAGRYLGPYQIKELEHTIGPFRASPLGAVPKSEPGEFRIIQDFSYPVNSSRTPSVNSEIDSDDFPCDWGSFTEVYKIVDTAPKGAQAATFDVDAAFRIIPVHPEDRRNIVVVWNGLAYVDTAVPFGAASSGGLFGHVADGLRAIMMARGLQPTRNWVDDFVSFRFPIPDTNPQRFLYNEDTIYAIGEELGDIPARTVSIPEEKKDKYRKRIQDALTKGRLKRKEVEKVIGTLTHCALATELGRTHLSSIANFLASFAHYQNPHLSLAIPTRTRDDLQWWLAHLADPFCGSRIRTPPDPEDLDFWVDASTSYGIGVVLNGGWDAWVLTAGWKSKGRDIGWAEMVAIELGLRVLVASGIAKKNIVLKSDNRGVIGALKMQRSRSYQQNLVLRRIVGMMLEHDIWISSEYVPSKDNVADGPSRGQAAVGRSRQRWFHLTPTELAPLLSPSKV
ncbi:hypothetical protein FRC04_004928 [Tulasnella sp. 424]|nr:hypothetical protein FRC04_004928 [Tulasnella sp. 424]KAG8973468.1 hypothetical protein FRC05_008742 [Tulasnella sp. 425]